MMTALSESVTGCRKSCGWQPLRFELQRLAVIRRQADGPFQVVQWIALGSGKS
jgi:hypothetical protein